MTITEVIIALQELESKGYGDYQVITDGYTNQEYEIEISEKYIEQYTKSLKV